MEIFMAVLVLLVLIGISNVINRYIPFVPIPLIQIALGSLAAALPFGVHLELEPELFFVLFIAPLLYNDGKHTPRDELWRLRAPILLMAVGLVFVTVFVVGFAIHRMIPSIPPAAAFGLAAILSPTDAVAVSAMASRIRLPKTLLRLLEGEALMNDASGLVAFKFAIAAMVTGVFSLPKATVSFFAIALGGLFIGALLATLISWVKKLLRRSGMEDVTMHMLIQILTPFLLYMVAEELGMSGILAAVAGGIVHAIERDRLETATIKLSTVSTNTWSVILFILNGLVFVLLGLQLPDVSRHILDDPAFNNAEVIGYAIIIYMMLIALRFLWTFLFTRGSLLLGSPQKRERPSLKILLLTSISGVRGAVTLAGAFSIPFFLNNGDPFPERSLILFIAATVILLSLVAASVLLPMLTRTAGKVDKSEKEKQERHYQTRVMTAAVQAMHQVWNDGNEAAVMAVIADYNKWIEQLRRKGNSRKSEVMSREKEIELRLLALKEERECAHRLLDQGQISREHASLFFKTLDQVELILGNPFHLWKIMFKGLLRRMKFIVLSRRDRPLTNLPVSDIEALRHIKVQTCEAAMSEINKKRSDSKEAATSVLSYYSNMLDRLGSFPFATRKIEESFVDQKKELHWVAIQAERNEVQGLYEKGEINRELAGRLRQLIRDREAAMFEQDEIG